MPKSDALQRGEKPVMRRQRSTLSCTECRRRKQKCNQVRDRPCNHCARRYPPVECVYEDVRDSSRSRDRLSAAEGSRSAEPPDETYTPSTDPSSSTPQLELLQPYFVSQLPFRTGSRESPGIAQEGHGYQEPSPVDALVSVRERSLSPASRELLQSHPGSSPDISRIFLIDGPRPDYRYWEAQDAARFNAARFGVLNVQVGDPAVEHLSHLPIDTSKRNAELLYFFVHRLSPFMSAIDGNDPPRHFTDEWMTFMIQSPLVAYLTILSASYFQAAARRIDVEKSVDAIAARMRLITMINDHITSHSKGVSDEAIAAVMSLSYNELIYSDKRSVVAHMSGLRGMIKTRGGIENIPVLVLRKLIARTDYQVACTFECEPFIHESRDMPVPVLTTYPLEVDSPLLQSATRFADSFEERSISPEAARVLDDMRYVTASIHAFHGNEPGADEAAKFLKTVRWIHDQLSRPVDPALAADFLYQTCRTVGLIYSAAVLARAPLSQACTPQLLQQLWVTMWRVPLPRWKRSPGIFLWVLLVVTPFTKDKPEGRFIKGMTAASIVAIGLVDWDTIITTLKGFLAVQKWLSDARPERGREAYNRLAVSEAPKAGPPSWAITE